jgi:hypothetical protein
MLEGRKPLAVFHDVYPFEPFERQMSRFDAFVRDGRFVRRIVDQPWPEPRVARGLEFRGTRKVYVSLADQAWRIDAYALLEKVAERSGWSESLERFQGALLGYGEEQNDWWIEHRRANRSPQPLPTPAASPTSGADLSAALDAP